MAGRFPYDSSGNSGNNPLNNLRAVLGLNNIPHIDEAVFLQRQQAERDFQLRQILLQEHIEQQNRLESMQSMMVQEQQLKAALGDRIQEFPELQQHYSRLLINEHLHRNEERTLATDRLRMQAEEELRRRGRLLQQQQQLQHQQQQQQQQQHQQQQHQKQKQQQQQQLSAQLPPQIQAAVPVVPKIQCVNQSMLRDIAADSLAGNAIKRSDFDKRQFAQPHTEITETPALITKKRARSSSKDSIDLESLSSRKENKEKKTKMEELVKVADNNVPKGEGQIAISHKKPSVQDLLDFASSTEPTINGSDSSPGNSSQPAPKSPRGSFGDLIEAARKEIQNDDAADILTSFKKDTTEWSDSEDEKAEEEEERQIAVAKGDTIMLPNFKSFLPQLPEEPLLALPVPLGKKKKKRKHKFILDEDDSSVETKPSGKKKDVKAMKDEEKKAFERAFGDLPYPIDPWWPTTTSIKRERKALGHTNYDDDENLQKVGDENQLRANLEKIEERLKHDAEPGVLEKIPHCRCHRMAMKKRKNSSTQELVYCTQVTELYPNEVMVCCSHCGTWRHTACGGHYKEYSVREAIEKPFKAVCDRCYVEEEILADKPLAQKRIDRQRCEQLRRGLSTSAAMRQHSFSKHGGTYKWPLGSVSATHIGGHTRSVHSRHDKAEKQWTDMATKLGRGYGHRPKEKVKVRTKEFERLLISIEDAEGHTDRHNMLVFLMQDTLKDNPVGFEKRHRNMFDPEDDDDGESEGDVPSGSEDKNSNKKSTTLPENEQKRCIDADNSQKITKKSERATCLRKGCKKGARFDSIFCSDACGVSVLESDLLRTFFYSSDIHPSSLRH